MGIRTVVVFEAIVDPVSTPHQQMSMKVGAIGAVYRSRFLESSL